MARTSTTTLTIMTRFWAVENKHNQARNRPTSSRQPKTTATTQVIRIATTSHHQKTNKISLHIASKPTRSLFRPTLITIAITSSQLKITITSLYSQSTTTTKTKMFPSSNNKTTVSRTLISLGAVSQPANRERQPFLTRDST